MENNLKLKRVKLTSKFFLITAGLFFILCPITHLYFVNQQIGHTSMHPSELFLILGGLRLLISFGYVLDDFYENWFFSKKLKSYHFYLTLPMVIILLLVPMFDTYFPTSEAKEEGTFYSFFGYFIVIASFGLLIGIGIYIVNILIGISKIINKKLRTTGL